jgi:E3 ubiquitin-protein ligase HUWE1
MEEQFAAEDVIDAEHGDEEEDVEMDFGEETGGSEGTSATEEDEEPEDPDDEEGDSEEDWHDEDEDEDLLEEDEENRAPEADGPVDPDVDVDGVWEVWRTFLSIEKCLHHRTLGCWYRGWHPGR